MVEEQAIVVGIENEVAMLEVIRRAPCSLCGQTRGCGISLWGRLFRHRPHVFKAANQVKARVGDLVIVGIEEQMLLKGSLLAYGIPLAAMMIGAMVAMALWTGEGNQDVGAVLGAALGLGVGLGWMKGHAMGYGPLRGRPVILRLMTSQ